MIKLITFDLDDTLWDNMPVLIRAEQKSWKRLCEAWPELEKRMDPKTLFELRFELLEQNPHLKSQLTELRRFSFQKALQECLCPEPLAAELADRLVDEFLDWRHEVKLFPEVQPVLSHLSGQYQLGVVTNGNIDIKRLEVSNYFDFSIRAQDYNSLKPEPVLFQKALERAGVEPEETLHVGDCLRADVGGAKALGIQTAWFNPEDKELPKGAEPDYVIRSLTGLFRVLDFEPVALASG